MLILLKKKIQFWILIMTVKSSSMKKRKLTVSIILSMMKAKKNGIALMKAETRMVNILPTVSLHPIP
ncbi:hypothetical protein HMPREF9080_01125 [Cardiobacterium valvarum F0432]|uniref:Uncharacterized protein n=1 Tax=Cardiobacterium valvarum F0432 TaxID=797473 RepID=G9ZEE0_9GAMM|nr:hypothetical protein HMPREF9080_01125 [Cardiobacterium valvarum F0432]